MQARDIMNTDFHVVHPEDSIAAAALQFEVASGKEGRKVFGLMVVDDSDHLVGMLSMYDILIFLQPKNMQVWGEMEDMNPDRLFDASLDKVRGVQVGDIMTPDVVTVTPHAHILAVSDIMIKNTSGGCRSSTAIRSSASSTYRTSFATCRKKFQRRGSHAPDKKAQHSERYPRGDGHAPASGQRRSPALIGLLHQPNGQI
jgi:CBS domain-containing protein